MVDFELSRSGGPGSGPSLSLEQQQQLEMQRTLEREQLQAQQLPQVLQTLDKQLDNNPQTQALLKRFKPDEQDEIKKALAQGVTERIGPNGLQRIDLLTTTNNGGFYVRFNRDHMFALNGDQFPKREQDGQSQDKEGKNGQAAPGLKPTEREAAPEHQQPFAPQKTLDTHPAREREVSQVERETPVRTIEPIRQPEPPRDAPENLRYNGNLSLAQRQQQELSNAPLDASQVAEPKFEHSVLAVEPIPYRNPFDSQPISHDPQQRQTDIRQQLEPKLNNALDSYTPTEQNQLKQALTTEISDASGNLLKIDNFNQQEDGRLVASLNRGLQQVYLDPQQVLQPEPQQEMPAREALSNEALQRQASQQQIQQQIAEQFVQHPPIDRLIMESRLREAVGDERIESMRNEGEDSIQLGLRNGMVLTASSYELLNMEDGRELLQRAQVDPATQNSQNTETGLNDPNSLSGRQLAQSPIEFTVRDGEGPAHIGKRIAPDHPDAAAWYVLQSLTENYGNDRDGIHYSPKANRLIVKEGQQGCIDLAGKSETELADAARQFRQYMGKESQEDLRRDEAAGIAERQRQQAEQAKAERDLAQQQNAREQSVVFLHNQSAQPHPSDNKFGPFLNRPQQLPDSFYNPLSGHVRLPLGPLPDVPQPDRRSVAEQGSEWLDKQTQPLIRAYQQGEKELADLLRVDANDHSVSAQAKRFAASNLGNLSGLGEWGAEAAVGGAKLVRQGGDAIFDGELIKLDLLSGGLLGRNVDYVRDAYWRQQQRLDTVQELGTKVGQLTVQGYQEIGKLYQQYQADPEQFKGDFIAASSLIGADIHEAADRRWQQSQQGYQTADLYQAKADAQLAAEVISVAAPAVGAGIKGIRSIKAVETVANAAGDANNAVKAARVLEESIDLSKDTQTVGRSLERSRGGQALQQPLEHSDDALRPAQQQALHRAEQAQAELDRATLDALNKQGAAVRAERQALETGTEQARQQAEEARKVADEALQRSADLDILHRPQKTIEFVKEEAPSKSFNHHGLDDASKEVGLNREQFHDLRMTRVQELTEQGAMQLKTVRDRVPVPDRNTTMYKVIPEEAIDKIMDGRYNPKISGFVVKADDISHAKTLPEMNETLRLDYRDTAFTEGKNTYGLIEFRVEKPETITIPYGERFGGETVASLPCTRNGFTACRNGEVIPEWKAKSELPQDGAKLYRVENGEKKLVGTYDKDIGDYVMDGEK